MKAAGRRMVYGIPESMTFSSASPCHFPSVNGEFGSETRIERRTRWRTPARLAAATKLRCCSAIRSPSIETRNAFSTPWSAASIVSGFSKSPTTAPIPCP